MNKDYEISAEQIMINMEIPFISLIEMKIVHELNDHAASTLYVLAESENQEDILNTDWSGTKISIWKKAEGKEALFRGSIERLICRKENKMLMLEIRGVGETVKLDREKKKRSFQNDKMTYGQVAQKIIEDYEGVGMIWNIDKDMQIGAPFIQYDETDWEFLMRLCSHFHKPIIADMRTEKPTFFLGMRHGAVRDVARMEIKEEGFDSIYFRNGCYESGEQGSKAFYLEAESRENWQMGDFISYNGGKYSICKKQAVFRRGELVYIYRLGMEGVYCRKKIFNEALTGIRLEGVIKKTVEEKVYIQLDIDKEERADYPWKWAPETNNLCYCMPETGTKAVLYLPSSEEKEGAVILSTVKNFQSSIYSDTQKREFLTMHHKRLGLYPTRFFMEGKDGAVSFSMEDQKGIQMNSETNISFAAEGEVFWEGRSIKITAPMEVVCKTKESNIELCRDINLYASGGVETAGTGKGVKKKQAVGKITDGRETEHWQASFSALAAVPAVDFGNIEGQDDIIDLFACGGIPKIANGTTTIALAETMEGKKMRETTFPDAFMSMENYTVKGGYALPEE